MKKLIIFFANKKIKAFKKKSKNLIAREKP